MARSIENGTNARTRPLSRSVKASRTAPTFLEGFAPPPGWARRHPDQALRMLYVCPQDAPWVDEIFG